MIILSMAKARDAARRPGGGDEGTINAGEIPVGNCEPEKTSNMWMIFSSSYMKIGYPLQVWID